MSSNLGMEHSLEEMERDLATLSLERDAAFKQVTELERKIKDLSFRTESAAARLAAFAEIRRIVKGWDQYGGLDCEEQVAVITEHVDKASEETPDTAPPLGMYRSRVV